MNPSQSEATDTVAPALPAWESLSRRLVSTKSDPHVTILRSAIISLNRSAVLALGCPAAVGLLYDRGRSMLGLRPADSGTEHAYHLRSNSRSANGPSVITAIAFAKFYEIDLSATRRWLAVMEGGVLCVDITIAGVPVTGGRATWVT